ncbi:MAG: hypothetical protein JO272_01165 [Pseudonocardiales bacterium]|nr:hypothetical protein [Pseudonocardiales bacterium]
MGAITDAAETLAAGIQKADITSARKLLSLFVELGEFERIAAAAKQTLATRLEEEFPTVPAVPEMLHRQASSGARFEHDMAELMSYFRQAHQMELQRLDQPRRGERAWDTDVNEE